MVDPGLLSALVAVNIAVLTGFGAVLWASYRSATGLRISLHGQNGDKGFIERTTEAHENLAAEQRRLRVQMQLHGEMLNETAITVGRLAEAVERETDAEVDVDRLDEVHERVDTRWKDDGRNDD